MVYLSIHVPLMGMCMSFLHVSEFKKKRKIHKFSKVYWFVKMSLHGCVLWCLTWIKHQPWKQQENIMDTWVINTPQLLCSRSVSFYPSFVLFQVYYNNMYMTLYCKQKTEHKFWTLHYLNDVLTFSAIKLCITVFYVRYKHRMSQDLLKVTTVIPVTDL